MFAVEGLEFCLDGRAESADDLELMMAKHIWYSRNHLPSGFLVTRWNGFGRLGRTTIFQFFVPQGAGPAYTVTQDPHDQCRLRPWIDKWARALAAATWGRFEEFYIDEPFLFLYESLTLYYPKHRFESRSIPESLDKDMSAVIKIAEVPAKFSYAEGGVYAK